MRRFLEKVPYPIAGLMLAYAALGNLLAKPIGSNAKLVCAILASFILVVLILKMIILPNSIKKAFGILPVASVMATLPMGMMLLSVYAKPYVGIVAMVLWALGLTLNIGIIIAFSIKYLVPWNIKNVYASYFVTYVGIVCASVTAKAFHMDVVGVGAFIFGLVSYGILIPIVFWRYIKYPIQKEPLKPLIIIFAAPANLLVVGYVQLGLQWSNMLLTVLWGIGILTTLFAWVQLLRLYRLKFYPSYSAYTFPLVIGATSTMQYSNYISRAQTGLGWIGYIGKIQMVVCTFAVFYVTLRYAAALFFTRAVEPEVVDARPAR